MRRVGHLLALAVVTLSLGTFAAGAAVAPVASEMTFYPQAGLLWRDLYVNNFVDLDAGPGVRDYACGRQTYDGHTGIDSDLLGFREMDIGVPVYAVLDGRVISIQDGNYDRNFGPNPTSRFDNHIVLEHGPGRFTIYGHLRQGIKLERRQRVRAGQQLGWTASSGNSTWPHLHFTSQVGSEVTEPFAGSCREGVSGWTEQTELPREPYLRDFAVSTKPMTGKRDLPHDLGPRTGIVARGARTIYTRIVLGALWRPADLRIRLLRPDGSVAREATHGSISKAHGYWYWWQPWRATFVPGRWRFVLELDGRVLAEPPLTVVRSAKQVRNRRPNAVSVSLHPAAPRPGDVVQCRVSTSLAAEDPDYDVVAYRYRWTVGSRVVRTVRSAALTDYVRRDVAASGERLTCAVTPTDGRLDAVTASVAATVSG